KTRETCVAGAEVVDGDAESCFAQPEDALPNVRHLGQTGALGDLEDDLRGEGQQRRLGAGKARIEEVADVQVDEKRWLAQRVRDGQGGELADAAAELVEATEGLGGVENGPRM